MNIINILAMYHEPKSNYAYAYNKSELHIRFRTEKNNIESIKILAADPFNWVQTENGSYDFEYLSMKKIHMIKEYSDTLFDYWFVSLNDFNHLRIKYAFVLQHDDNKIFYGSTEIQEIESEKDINLDFKNFYNFPFINEEDVFKAPNWVKNTVWYQIFTERFANHNNVSERFLPWDSKENVELDMFFGGNLEGVIKRLDYIQDLGITGIYFTPIFTSPSSHKYDIIDYFNIDPDFGNNQIFKQLVKEAHNRGIKIMLDAVFNHCGYLHPYWQDVLKLGKDSKYYNWFHIIKEPQKLKEDENGLPQELSYDESRDLFYRTFAFVPSMPKWNTANKEARKYLLSIAKYWVEEFDIDGWRLDVSNEVSHCFWRHFRKTIKEIKEDAYIVGENWDNSYPWLLGDQFDSVMNYSFLNTVWGLLGNKNNTNLTNLEFKNKLSKLLVSYPKNVAQFMFNMLDSHDTDRLMTVCDNNVHKVKLAYLIQLTFSGAPSIYYGSEIGITGIGDGNRKCMPWDESKQNLEIKNHVKKLIEIRKKLESTKTVDIKFLCNYENDDFICYEKSSNFETLYLLINTSDSIINVELPSILCNKTFTDIYNNIDVNTVNTLTINPYGFYMLVSYK